VSASLPKDVEIVELRPEVLTLETRKCLLPGYPLAFQLLLEGKPLAVRLNVGECLVVDHDRHGYLYHLRLFLADLSDGDRSLIALFISKGRGEPGIVPVPVVRE
jgi:hypothetical protein